MPRLVALAACLALASVHCNAPGADPGAHPKEAASASAAPGMPAVDAPDGDFAGAVSQRLDAGSYTYLRIALADGRREWVVTLGDGAPIGSHVDIVNMGVRQNFVSRRLDRSFSRLVFAIVRTRS